MGKQFKDRGIIAWEHMIEEVTPQYKNSSLSDEIKRQVLNHCNTYETTPEEKMSKMIREGVYKYFTSAQKFDSQKAFDSWIKEHNRSTDTDTDTSEKTQLDITRHIKDTFKELNDKKYADTFKEITKKTKKQLTNLTKLVYGMTVKQYKTFILQVLNDDNWEGLKQTINDDNLLTTVSNEEQAKFLKIKIICKSVEAFFTEFIEEGLMDKKEKILDIQDCWSNACDDDIPNNVDLSIFFANYTLP